jgi:hypothetical protein
MHLNSVLRAPARLMQSHRFDRCHRKSEESKQTMTFANQGHSIVVIYEPYTGPATALKELERFLAVHVLRLTQECRAP